MMSKKVIKNVVRDAGKFIASVVFAIVLVNGIVCLMYQTFGIEGAPMVVYASEDLTDSQSTEDIEDGYVSMAWPVINDMTGKKYLVVGSNETTTVQTDVPGSSSTATSSSDSSNTDGNTDGSSTDNSIADNSTDDGSNSIVADSSDGNCDGTVVSSNERIIVITEGTVDSDWVAKVQAQADLLPQSVINWFNGQGNRLSVVDYDLASTYGYSVRICGITVAHNGYSEIKVEPRTNGVNAVVHEIGHSIDYAGTTSCQYSSQSEFTEAFDEEGCNISGLNLKSVSLNGAPYYPECFAEAFAAYVTQPDFRTSCPMLTDYFDGILATLG